MAAVRHFVRFDPPCRPGSSSAGQQGVAGVAGAPAAAADATAKPQQRSQRVRLALTDMFRMRAKVGDNDTGEVLHAVQQHNQPHDRSFYSPSCYPVPLATIDTKLVHLGVRHSNQQADLTNHYWVKCAQLSGMGEA